MPDNEETLYPNYVYEVDIDQLGVGEFTHVTGLGAESSVLTYQEGGLHDVTYQLPTDVSYANVQLYRGLTDDNDLIEWFTNAATRRKKRHRDVTISVKDRTGNIGWIWRLGGAYPVKWRGPDLAGHANAGPNPGLSIEHVELAYQTLNGKPQD